jgi:hypothetical protein
MNTQIDKINGLLCQKILVLDRFFAAQDIIKSGLHEQNSEPLGSINPRSFMISLVIINFFFWSEEVSNKI